MAMSSMDKMWMSFIAIGLMIAASVLVLFTRSKFGAEPAGAAAEGGGEPEARKNGRKILRRVTRFILMLVSAVLFFYGIIFMFISLV